MAAQRRFAIILPILFGLITSGLWFSARAQYLNFLCPPAGACPTNGWPLGWTDYSPPSLQAAGMLNIPIAFFAQPLYRLVHDGFSKWKLIALLLGVAILWSYIGWRLDTRSVASHRQTSLRIFAVVLGCVFALVVLIQTMLMFHVGLLYKVIAVCWSLLMLRHFILLLRTSSAAPQSERLSSRWRLPRIGTPTIAVSWAAFLILGALALPPRDSSGNPDAALAHVFAGCGALLLLVTAYVVFVYLIVGWRKVRTTANSAPYVVWIGFDTFLALAAIAAVAYVAVRG